MRFTLIVTSFVLFFQPVFANDAAKTDAANSPTKDLRALVVPKKEATLSSSILGRILKLEADIGDNVKKGQVLVSFDPGSYLAEYNKAKAELNEATKIHAATQKLVKNDAVSLLEVTRAEASLQKAKADLELRQHFLNECRIVAPYDCRVTKKFSNAHEVVPAGAKLLSIVGDEPLRIQLLVPSQHFENLKLKNKLNVTLDETKQTYPVTISQIGAKIDPASQSVEVLADFEKYDPKVIVGMSGIAQIQ
jgi:membrane fusion protein (multidrug efflux system)